MIRVLVGVHTTHMLIFVVCYDYRSNFERKLYPLWCVVVSLCYFCDYGWVVSVIYG